MKKTFLLGVGCQKGGTTWLHSQLEKCSDVNLGFIKEYHVFDALYLPEFDVFYQQKIQYFESLKLNKRAYEKKANTLTHLSFYLDVNHYFEYFDYLWLKGEQTSLVGDITPSYAALPIEALNEIKEGLESKGFDVKVVFIMRDPIERCWSVSRMNLKNWERKRACPIPDEREHLIKKYQSHECEIRTRYESTIRNLESVFENSNIFYTLYENLFDAQTIVEIKNFLGLKTFCPDVEVKINANNKSEGFLEIDEPLQRSIFEFYRSTYEYCDARFKVKYFWLGAKFL